MTNASVTAPLLSVNLGISTESDESTLLNANDVVSCAKLGRKADLQMHVLEFTNSHRNWIQTL